MKTITLQFADSDDLKAFEKYIGMAKAQEGTVTGLYCGLMCSALKRSKIIPNNSALAEAAKNTLEMEGNA